MKLSRFALLLGLLALLTVPLAAQDEPHPTQATGSVTLELPHLAPPITLVPLGKPTPPPANPQIVYILTRIVKGGYLNDLYVMDADGSHKTLLRAAKNWPSGYQDPNDPWDFYGYNAVGFGAPGWSPDKSKIVVVEEDPTYTCGGIAGSHQMKRFDLAMVNGALKITGQHLLLDCNGNPPLSNNTITLAWSNDGSRIAYGGWVEIRTIPADGYNNSALVYTESPQDGIEDLTWSPDDSKIAYILLEPQVSNNSSAIKIYDFASGVSSYSITPDLYKRLDGADWSHNGNWIVFSGSKIGSTDPIQVWKYDPAVGPDSAVVLDSNSGQWTTWSLDDSKVVFQADVGTAPWSGIKSHDVSSGVDTTLCSNSKGGCSNPDN